jgi:hypothetical protein
VGVKRGDGFFLRPSPLRSIDSSGCHTAADLPLVVGLCYRSRHRDDLCAGFANSRSEMLSRAKPYLHRQGLDTGTPAGKAMFQMMGVFAEFERAMIVERVKSGLARARSEGKRLGRRPVGDDVVERIRTELVTGAGILRTAKLLSVGTGTVHRIKREMAAVTS